MNPQSLQTVALSVAQERSLDTVLTGIVDGLAAQDPIALARLWLIGPGDLCETCPLRTSCPDRTRCLHLAASGGGTGDDGNVWACMDHSVRRFPLHFAKIGEIGATGAPLLIQDMTIPVYGAGPHPHAVWAQGCPEGSLLGHESAARQGIVTFAGQPLVFRGEVLGVFAVFSRAGLTEEKFNWLRAFADAAAVAIANSRALAEIEALKRKLEYENDYLREEVNVALSFGDIIGKSAALVRVLQQIELVAPTEATVLILGESGTGKELLARQIHERSTRLHRPLIKVNCSSIPRELFESEFFGHVKGSFTGAHRDRVGRFQLADGGTLFLDEIGEIPLELQSKLLRVLQEGEFERVGDEVTRRVDVRILAATNRDLRRAVEEGSFRADLYYRLSVFPIDVPPLRERREDVRLLAGHFVEMASRRLGLRSPQLTRGNVEALEAYDWPGNVRELQNVIEHAVILSKGGRLPLELPYSENAPVLVPESTRTDAGVVTDEERRRRDRENILAALYQTCGKIYGPGGAAELLGVKPTTLASRIKALGLVPGTIRGARTRPTGDARELISALEE